MMSRHNVRNGGPLPPASYSQQVSHTFRIPSCRAGHAATLRRHRDHVFRPKKWLIIATIPYVCFRCDVVVVAKLKNCCVPSAA